eukprot:230029-Pleurochrysis_carterae.AAC.1
MAVALAFAVAPCGASAPSEAPPVASPQTQAAATEAEAHAAVDTACARVQEEPRQMDVAPGGCAGAGANAGA